MVKADFRIRNVKFICCLLLILICTVLGLRVQAVEEEDALSPISVKVYSEMSDNSDIAANLIVGNAYEMLETTSDAEGGIWYRIKTSFGIEGYVKAAELDRLTTAKTQTLQQEEEEHVEGSETDTIDENASEENDASNAVEGDETIGELITLAAVNLRSMPSTDAEVIGKINKDTKLTYIQEYVNDAGESWYKVEYGGMTGYLIERVVKITQRQQSNEDVQASDVDSTDSSDTWSEETSQESAPSQESETIQENEAVQESQTVQESENPEEEEQSDLQTLSIAQAEFEVSEATDTQKKEHKRGGVDLMIAALIAGGILCIAVIVVFLRKIRKLLRQ